jgi:hypothetical protein
MLGSLAEAEDAVQETYARWYAMSVPQREAVENPGAWLTRVASRICLNLLGSARARRETYVGAWLPEPLPDPAEWPSGAPGLAVDPADWVTLPYSTPASSGPGSSADIPSRAIDRSRGRLSATAMSARGRDLWD